MEKIERENQELRKRLEALEHMAQREGIMASGEAPKTMPVAALSSINISGFVQASYFYNTQTPADGKSDGYLWNAALRSVLHGGQAACHLATAKTHAVI